MDVRHIIEPSDLSVQEILSLFRLARFFHESSVKCHDFLRDKFLFVVFEEDSTRTRLSFDMAMRRLGGQVVHFYPEGSSLSKGETFTDTLRNITHLGADFLAVRHRDSHIFRSFEENMSDPRFHLISAGHGSEHHPTQGLLDVFTISYYQHKDWDKLSVLVVGDIRYGRAIRSQIQVLTLLGCRDIRLVAPPCFQPHPQDPLFQGLSRFSSLDEANIGDADVVSLLRIQRERIVEQVISPEAYREHYTFLPKHLEQLKKTAIIIHPQPLNRGVEIADDIVDAPHSRIFDQVSMGVVLRMACLCFLGHVMPSLPS